MFIVTTSGKTLPVIILYIHIQGLRLVIANRPCGHCERSAAISFSLDKHRAFIPRFSVVACASVLTAVDTRILMNRLG